MADSVRLSYEQRDDADTEKAARGAVTLREITDSNRADVLRLAVTPEQSDFVDGVAVSLDEAAAKPDACHLR